jgi:site-specific DNA-cytosine methylase
MAQIIETREFTHFHFFCGLGGGARGFNRGVARLGNREGHFRCIGGIDVDPGAIRNFERLAGVPGTCMDLFDLDQYRAFHGRMPPAGWREAIPADIRNAAGNERPDVVFLSAPCKGFSGLLSETTSVTDKYQALNRLTLRGVWLMLEAWAGDPPSLIIFENVPRIATRGRKLLDQIIALLRHYGYQVAETTHDCGEIGGLAQSRKRFLLVARHAAKVPPFLYEPLKHSLRGVGEILDRMPLPGDPAGGAMHRVPSLQWKTWVRLAFVEAGSDWRSLNRLNVADGVFTDFGILPERQLRNAALGVTPWSEHNGAVIGESMPSNGRFAVADPREFGAPHNGSAGVQCWDEPAGTVTSNGRPHSGTFSVADPRVDGHHKSVQMGVRTWDDSAATVTGQYQPGQGPFSVADPRPNHGPGAHQNKFRIIPYAGPAGAITGSDRVGSGAPCVADPRPGRNTADLQGNWHVNGYGEPSRAVVGGRKSGAAAVADPRPSPREDYKQTKYRVTAMDEAAGVVIAASTTGNGAFAVADPRPDCLRDERDHYNTQGHYGVTSYDEPSRAVPAFAKNNNGSWSVADPRHGAELHMPASDIILPAGGDRLVCIIRALDGTWHRPFTTLELAALQSLIDVEDPGTWAPFATSDSDCREQIGNAVPSEAAGGMADTFLHTLLLAEAGETFMLSSTPIWVRPLAVALAVDTSQVPA